MKFILLILISILIIISADQSLLVLLRPRSRHTSTLYYDILKTNDFIYLKDNINIDDWNVPKIELISLYKHFGGTGNLKFIKYNNNNFEQFQRIDFDDNNDNNINAIKLSIERSILSYGLYEILAEGKTIIEIKNQLIENFQSNIQSTTTTYNNNNNNDDLKIDVAVGVVDNPYVSMNDILNLLIQFQDIWKILSLKFTNFKTIKLFTNNLCNDNDNDRLYIICNQLSKSLAAPKKNGQGNREPLPMMNANRRPVSGIFKNYALKKMPFISKTAMEPELSILMANFANINENSKVLDPFCGSCQLLLASALQGSRVNVGIDKEIDEEKVLSNFKFLNLQTPPTLYQALSESLIHSNKLSSTFTAIITDPPYAMSESIYQGDDNMITRDNINNDQDANIYTNKVIQNLLTLASKYLDTEGRLVFFLPFRQKIWNNVNGINLLPTLPQNLEFLFSLKQVLSPTFARYLIVIKKNYN